MDTGVLLKMARRRLMADSGFAALLGVDVGKDTQFTQQYPDQAYADGWVFQASDGDGRPKRDPQSTGMSAVTLGSRSSWTTGNAHNSQRFPQLICNVWADVSRPPDDSSVILRRDAGDRASRVGSAIRDVFHDPGNQNQWWALPEDFPPDGFYVNTCVVGVELTITDVLNADGAVLGTIRFNLSVD